MALHDALPGQVDPGEMLSRGCRCPGCGETRLIEVLEERAGRIFVCLVCAWQWGSAGVRTRAGPLRMRPGREFPGLLEEQRQRRG